VSAEDYQNGNHDQHCPSCQEESESECCGCQQFGDDGCKCDCHSEDEESGDDERMIHDRLDWEKRYSKDKHEGCDEEDCPGQTCVYNCLCAGCDCVMSKRVHSYGLQYKYDGLPDKETMVCSDCFHDLVDGMRAENKITKHWVVGDDDDWEEEENSDSE
jgi:hypothetical protein